MAGLVPAIYDFLCCQDVDARDKPGHDEFVGTSDQDNGRIGDGRAFARPSYFFTNGQLPSLSGRNA